MSRPIDLVLSRLDAFKLRENARDRWRACCPAHGGKNASSLSIGVGADDQVLLRCWAGCEVEQVAHALGLELSDLFPPKVTNGHGSPPIKRRRLLTAGQALDLLEREALVLFIVGTDMNVHKAISDDDHARLAEAVARIQSLGAEVHA